MHRYHGNETSHDQRTTETIERVDKKRDGGDASEFKDTSPRDGVDEGEGKFVENNGERCSRSRQHIGTDSSESSKGKSDREK